MRHEGFSDHPGSRGRIDGKDRNDGRDQLEDPEALAGSDECADTLAKIRRESLEKQNK